MIKANYTQITHILTLISKSTNPDVAMSASYASLSGGGTYNYGSAAYIGAASTDTSRWNPVYWTDENGHGISSPVTMTRDMTLYALFDPVVYIVAASAASSTYTSQVYSKDCGATWLTSSGTDVDRSKGVAYANGLFIKSRSSSSTTTSIKQNYSTDGGANLSNATSFARGKHACAGVINGTAIYLIEQSREGTSTDKGAIYYSTNGSTFTMSSGYRTRTDQIVDIAFGNGMFLLLDTCNNGHLYKSTDGNSWSQCGTSLTDTWTSSGLRPHHLDFVNGEFVMLHRSTVYRSTDGNTWTTEGARTFLPGYGLSEGQISCNCIAYKNGVYVAGFNGDGKPYITISSNKMVSWNVVLNPTQIGKRGTEYGDIHDIVVANNWVVAVYDNETEYSSNYNPTTFLRSSDLSNWGAVNVDSCKQSFSIAAGYLPWM